MTRGKPPEREAKLIAAIRAAGSIRTKELAEATGVQGNNIGTALAAAIARGDVYVCKVAPGDGQTGRSTNEYRIGGGMPVPEFVPLNPRRAALASMAASVRRTPSTQAATGTLPARTEWPATPVFLSSTTPQAQVGDALRDRETASRAINSASRHAGASTEPPPAVPADTANMATPGPEPKGRGMGPAAAKAPAGDVKKLRLAIDQDGSLQLGDDTDPAQFVFPPEQVLQLGDFLHCTQEIWRP